MEPNETIYEVLHEAHLPTYVIGYQYIHDAIAYLLEVPEPEAVVFQNELYPYLARLYNKPNPSSIERSIRTAIGIGYPHMPTEIRNNYNFVQHTQPSNRKFIYALMLETKIRIREKCDTMEEAGGENMDFMEIALSMSPDAINALADTGVFNDIIRGYLVATLSELDYTDSEIEAAADMLDKVLDYTDAASARRQAHQY